MDDTTKLFDIVKQMEEDVGTEKWETLQQYFTPTFSYKVGSLEPKIGIEGLKEYMLWQNTLVHWKGHEIHLIAKVDNALIVEVTSFFHRLVDNKRITLPCTDIYRFDDLKITDWRVYADISIFK
ncbi:MAG: nuclear transport factor 2 family protein [Bacteroidota bacterium]